MAYVADLHIHSKYSRACSGQITIPNLSKWAKIKGIDLIGTSDFLHPLWQAEIKSNLKVRGDGLFEYDGVKFLLTCEISCIYSDKGKVRRIHLVACLPTLESLTRLCSELSKRKVNMASDGRPITGLSALELSKIILDVEPKAIIFPAHIWTPWFSLFGSMSGYDFLGECFGDLSDKILAIETGMSSEPAMNWRIADLDKKSIISFSDAHSLPNLGREATIFGGNLSYDELRQDLETGNIVGTIEFFPEEGKYHYSGHRNCGIVYGPQDLKANGEICPKCGKKLTIGVMERVEELATRSPEDLEIVVEEGITKSKTFPKRPGFRMLVELDKIIGEAVGSGRASKKTQGIFDKLITVLGSELKILTKVSVEEIKSLAGERVAEGVLRVREGKLKIEPGFDNTYGKVSIWDEEEKDSKDQLALF
ncbi:MAG: endonuclease Q family protein [Candidatus Daviesbacteria bacterium]